MRDHGRVDRGDTVLWGFNARMDNLAAAFLLIQLRHFDETVTRRRAIASRYQERLAESVPGLKLPEAPGTNADHFDTFQNYELESDFRDALQTGLSARGIGTLQQLGWLAHPPIREAGIRSDNRERRSTVRADAHDSDEHGTDRRGRRLHLRSYRTDRRHSRSSRRNSRPRLSARSVHRSPKSSIRNDLIEDKLGHFLGMFGGNNLSGSSQCTRSSRWPAGQGQCRRMWSVSGFGFMSWLKLSTILEPENLTRRIYGFDILKDFQH